MKALRFFEMSATTFQSKRSYIQEKINLQEHGYGKTQIAQNFRLQKNNTFFLDQMNVFQYL